jgi:AcrR family transcriptional regulator
MPRPQIVPDEQILAAAREIFLAEGVTASTLTIAKRAGVSEGTLFKRFGTKEALFLAALEISAEPAWVKTLDGFVGQGEPQETLMALSLQMVASFRELMPRIIVLRSRGLLHPFMQSLPDPPPVRAHRALTQYFTREIELGRFRTFHPSAAASLLLGALTHFVLVEELGGAIGASDRDFVRDLVETLWQGIGSE